MNSSETAKKGFRTFILTLSVSLILFSVIYYALTYTSTSTQTLEISEDSSLQSSIQDQSKETAFGQLAYSKVETQPKQVLAAGDTTVPSTGSTTPSNVVTTTSVTTPQTTTPAPQTGTVEVTLALIFSAMTFILAMYWQSLNPRAVALSDFEKKSRRGL